MPDIGQLGQILSGTGAWFAGQGPQYERNKLLEEKQRQQAQEREFLQDERRQKALVQDMFSGYQLLDEGQTAGALKLIENRIAGIDKLGGDAGHTMAIRQMIQDGNVDQAKQEILPLITAGAARGWVPSLNTGPEFLGAKDGQATFRSGERVYAQEVEGYQAPVDNTRFAASAKTKIYDNGTVVQAMPDGSTQVRGPSGKMLSGEDRRKALQQARREEVLFAKNKAEATKTGTEQGGRVQVTINEGLDAAKGAAVLRRGLGLLESIETGGFDTAQLKAKQLFGVESADEAELSSSLGKAVLSQLRATFGAQFTEREGARLAEIEAGFGKSTAGNKRLLNQTLQLVQRSAKRGIKAAVGAGDYRSAADIQELLDFQLEDEALMQQFGASSSEAPATPPAGAIKFLGFEQ